MELESQATSNHQGALAVQPPVKPHEEQRFVNVEMVFAKHKTEILRRVACGYQRAYLVCYRRLGLLNLSEYHDADSSVGV